MKKLVVGILAHVDAGKTTLAESMMFATGNIRKLGRVDHKDTFLDTYELERDRGITIFAKQAILRMPKLEITLIDTPGHVDFSSEMERTLQILDYAILLISARDGVQAYTETLWNLLKNNKIPTFVFINKMDMVGTDKEALKLEIKERLSQNCIDFTVDHNSPTFIENLAMCDEHLLDEYINNGRFANEDIVKAIKESKVFPCYFGSALKSEGVDDLLNGIENLTKKPKYSKKFGARIYKISRDQEGNRLTFMKITGGSIKVKKTLSNVWNCDSQEKIDQIRIYSGSKYEIVDELQAGSVCAVTGLSKTFQGQGLGIESSYNKMTLEPVLNYRLILGAETNVNEMLANLKRLQEEEPQLNVCWNEKLREIHVKLMGKIQGEIFKSIILNRFGVEVDLDAGSIIYKETITDSVIGIGHFGPLGHYAEVHLLLEAGKPGSGLTYKSICSEDTLALNWQRLILTHLQEKEHIGVLTGSPITDIKITLLTGRAHRNHTVGGDFRQATYRAVRQGLMKAKSVLLEPYYNFKMKIPTENIGRAMTDIQQMHGKFTLPKTKESMSELTGYVPVSTLGDYQTQVNSYTRGRGRVFLTFKGFEPCHNPNEVASYNPYDSEYTVKINGDIPRADYKGTNYGSLDKGSNNKKEELTSASIYKGTYEEDKELESIFVRTFGPIERKLNSRRNLLGHEKQKNIDKKSNSKTHDSKAHDNKAKANYLLVDGYNIIFGWEELRDLADKDLYAARTKLADILSDYQGYKKMDLILVFDAYKVEGGRGEVIDHGNISIVFTKEAETADMYIEKVTKKIGKKHNVVVATSDYAEQLIIMGHGAMRISTNDLKEEIELVKQEIRKSYLDK